MRKPLGATPLAVLCVLLVPFLPATSAQAEAPILDGRVPSDLVSVEKETFTLVEEGGRIFLRTTFDLVNRHDRPITAFSLRVFYGSPSGAHESRFGVGHDLYPADALPAASTRPSKTYTLRDRTLFLPGQRMPYETEPWPVEVDGEGVPVVLVWLDSVVFDDLSSYGDRATIERTFEKRRRDHVFHQVLVDFLSDLSERPASAADELRRLAERSPEELLESLRPPGKAPLELAQVRGESLAREIEEILQNIERYPDLGPAGVVERTLLKWQYYLDATLRHTQRGGAS